MDCEALFNQWVENIYNRPRILLDCLQSNKNTFSHTLILSILLGILRKHSEVQQRSLFHLPSMCKIRYITGDKCVLCIVFRRYMDLLEYGAYLHHTTVNIHKQQIKRIKQTIRQYALERFATHPVIIMFDKPMTNLNINHLITNYGVSRRYGLPIKIERIEYNSNGYFSFYLQNGTVNKYITNYRRLAIRLFVKDVSSKHS